MQGHNAVAASSGGRADALLHRPLRRRGPPQQKPLRAIAPHRLQELELRLLLDTLCVIWKCIRQRSGRLLLCNLSEFAYDILKVSRLNQLWPVYNSREEALDAVRLAQGASGADSTRDEDARAACQR